MPQNLARPHSRPVRNFVRSPFVGILCRVTRPRYSPRNLLMDNLTMDAVAAGDISLDLLATELVEHARGRARMRRLGSLQERLALALAGTFLATAVSVALFLPAGRGF